ncbi:unnamed protein product [Taenia asiatica]|uniref:Mitochondrial 28S ribosomal protein S17 n=1 Tax=Taenia asiatica TaxID=60517 RepID=A0A0R3WB50_TAEAS|nr:unnamed protein product [Taenia asiatica]
MVRYWVHRSARVQKLVAPHVQRLFPFHKPELEGVSPVDASHSGKVVKAPFDLALGKFFYQTQTYWAHKQGVETDIGDIVLVEKCDPPIAFNTVYKLRKVVFPVGNIVDPISGLRCEGPDYPLEVMQQWLDEHQQDP